MRDRGIPIRWLPLTTRSWVTAGVAAVTAVLIGGFFAAVHLGPNVAFYQDSEIIKVCLYPRRVDGSGMWHISYEKRAAISGRLPIDVRHGPYVMPETIGSPHR
jgi:hypothetical protein